MLTLLTNGPTARRINVVLLSEGYTTNDLGRLPDDARRVLTSILSTPPFNEYSNYFNAFAIAVPSNESGSDHPSSGTYRDTYFNSSYDTAGIQRLLAIDGTGQSRVHSLLAAFMPEYDIVGVVVNDPMYGGSGGSLFVTSVHASGPEAAIHELGHSYSGLGDEYESAYPGYPDTEEPNTTTQTNRTLLKWTPWVLPSTLIPTPAVSSNSAVVGLFEGAHYHPTGWYRPKLNCKMRSLGVVFCPVCAEALVTSIYTQVRPIDAWTPVTNAVIRLTNAAAATLSVTNLRPSSHALTVQWFTNNRPVPGATNATFSVTGFQLPVGTNSVRVEVTDPTSLVRTDATGKLADSRTWRVQGALARPRLLATTRGASVELSWTPEGAGFVLESAPGVNSPQGWQPLLTVGTQTSITLPLANGQTFFRLRNP